MDRLYMNIRNRRKELRMTQKELAEKCGYTDHTTINKMENGKVDVTFGKLQLIAEALETTVVDLILGGADDEV